MIFLEGSLTCSKREVRTRSAVIFSAWKDSWRRAFLFLLFFVYNYPVESPQESR